MKIQYLKRAAGPDGNFAPGQIREVNEAMGKTLIEAEAAVEIRPIEDFEPKSKKKRNQE